MTAPIPQRLIPPIAPAIAKWIAPDMKALGAKSVKANGSGIEVRFPTANAAATIAPYLRMGINGTTISVSPKGGSAGDAVAAVEMLRKLPGVSYARILSDTDTGDMLARVTPTPVQVDTIWLTTTNRQRADQLDKILEPRGMHHKQLVIQSAQNS